MKNRTAFLALGSNIGDRRRNLAEAVERIANFPGVTLAEQTDVEETEPVGLVEQPPFLNQMVAVDTSLDPIALLEMCHVVEDAGGRVRTEHWGPRTIDVDIVEISGVVMDDEGLTVPHREIPNRDFWRRELADLKSRNADPGKADG